MRKLLLVSAAIAVLPWIVGCEQPAAKSGDVPVAATSRVEPAAATPTSELADALTVEHVVAVADLGPLPHPAPKPPHYKPIGPKPPVHPKFIGPQPKGYFKPYAGHPYFGGKHGPWAKYWVGPHHHGHHYLYGVYLGGWAGYTYRVWNGRWLYWSPLDFCWYRYDQMLGVFIPLNPDGTDAVDTAPPPPPPVPLPTPPPVPPQ